MSGDSIPSRTGQDQAEIAITISICGAERRDERDGYTGFRETKWCGNNRDEAARPAASAGLGSSPAAPSAPVANPIPGAALSYPTSRGVRDRLQVDHEAEQRRI